MRVNLPKPGTIDDRPGRKPYFLFRHQTFGPAFPGAQFIPLRASVLLERVERTKLGAAAKPRTPRVIRPGTDEQDWRRVRASRHIASDVKRAVWRRDGGQCGFVAHDGQRCTEHAFLEFHHIRPYAQGGLATVENISLRCRRHNQYEAEVVFGPHGTSVVGETHESWRVGTTQRSGRFSRPTVT